MKWTIKGNGKTGSLRTYVDAETEEEARKLFLKKNPEYDDVLYVRESGRYSYLVTEEGVMNPKYADKFRGGRVEVFDVNEKYGYAVYEWRFFMPSNAFYGFVDWIENIETDYPIMIRSEFNMDTLEYEL